MSNSLLTVVAIAGLAGVTISPPALAKSHKHVGYGAPLPVVVVRPSSVPQFITVGPNGYWVTTTWSCWVDDGQGRIHDCESGK